MTIPFGPARLTSEGLLAASRDIDGMALFAAAQRNDLLCQFLQELAVELRAASRIGPPVLGGPGLT